jgi:hypothetical protein
MQQQLPSSQKSGWRVFLSVFIIIIGFLMSIAEIDPPRTAHGFVHSCGPCYH